MSIETVSFERADPKDPRLVSASISCLRGGDARTLLERWPRALALLSEVDAHTWAEVRKTIVRWKNFDVHKLSAEERAWRLDCAVKMLADVAASVQTADHCIRNDLDERAWLLTTSDGSTKAVMPHEEPSGSGQAVSGQ